MTNRNLPMIMSRAASETGNEERPDAAVRPAAAARWTTAPSPVAAACRRFAGIAGILSLGIVLSTGTTGAAEDAPYAVWFVKTPEFAEEGHPIRVEVRYRTPSDTKFETLHCDMKSDNGVYLKGLTRRIRGKGRTTFEFPAPSPAACPRVAFYGWIGPQWPETRSSVAVSDVIPIISAKTANRLREYRKRAAAFLKEGSVAPGGTPVCAVFQAGASTWPPDVLRAVEHAAESAGFRVVRIPADALINPYLLTPARYSMLVIVDAGTLPGEAGFSLPLYHRNGGILVLLGGPAFSGEVLISWNGRWMTRSRFREEVSARTPERILMDFRRPRDLGGAWERATNAPDAPSRVVWVPQGAADPGAALLDIRNLHGWDTFRVPLPTPIFRKGETWTTFRAKGDKSTPELSVEWREKDGSRWITVVPLSTKWQRYVLPPTAFRYWHDSASKGRGGAGDSFRPENADALIFGLAFSHTQGTPPGDHRIYIDDIGVSPGPPDTVDSSLLASGSFSPPVLEGMSPRWKFYPVTNAAKLRMRPGQVLLPPVSLDAPAAGKCWAPHPRPGGAGFRKQRRQRVQPLIEFLDKEGRVCGAAAALYLPRGKGGKIGQPILTVPQSDPRFVRDLAASHGFAALLKRITDGAFLFEGGAAWYASFGNEDVPVGAMILNRAGTEFAGTVRMRIEGADGKTVRTFQWAASCPAAGTATVRNVWHAPARPGTRYRVITELLRNTDGAVIDRLEHEFRIVRLPDSPKFVQRRSGHFFLDGRRWFVHGVNYMPSSGIALDKWAEFELWLNPAPYDPEIIERDLDDIQRIGFNAVSVFQYYDSRKSHNLIDLLDRCRDHGLRVNLSLRPGTPLDFPWEQVREMILLARLPENDTVFAYDLAWEPHWGRHDQRRRWDGLWRKWVIEKYGSVKDAEKAWRFSAPRENGRLTNPTDEQVSRDGPWRRMVRDYRTFVNDVIRERYGRARRLIRTIDPHHLVSFRMSSAGDPSAYPGTMPYDPAGVAGAVDIMEPEGYGRIGDWNRVRMGWFTVAYCRAVAPDLPVVWAEFGLSIWDNGRMQVSPAGLERQGKFYDDFYRMVRMSGGDGTFCWWFAGGYRWDERSDFGILNPDRSWRPATRAAHRWAGVFRNAPPGYTPDVFIECPPASAFADGILGLYREVKDRFWRAADSGRRPALRIRK